MKFLFSEPQLKGVKTRLECRGSETGPRYFLEVTPEGKVQGCPEGDGESTLLYLIPVGLRYVMSFLLDFLLKIIFGSKFLINYPIFSICYVFINYLI